MHIPPSKSMAHRAIICASLAKGRSVISNVAYSKAVSYTHLSIISCIVMLKHFFSKTNTLKFQMPQHILHKLKRITITGFSTFFIDIAMGILTILFNRQIMNYLGTDALSIYGIIVNISTFVQCCAYSIGQAAQPIISVNYGAKLGFRIKKVLNYALATVLFFSIFWTALSAFCLLYTSRCV